MSGRPDTRQKCLKFAATGLAARIAFTWFAICGCRCFMAISATIWCPSQPHVYARNGAIAKKRMAREYCSYLVFMVERNSIGGDAKTFLRSIFTWFPAAPAALSPVLRG